MGNALTGAAVDAGRNLFRSIHAAATDHRGTEDPARADTGVGVGCGGAGESEAASRRAEFFRRRTGRSLCAGGGGVFGESCSGHGSGIRDARAVVVFVPYISGAAAGAGHLTLWGAG